MLLSNISAAHFIPFDNCLSDDTKNPYVDDNNPLPLQFDPLFVWAAFNSTAPSHNLNMTVYGNVTGVARKIRLPSSPADAQWSNANNTEGKIPVLAVYPGNPNYTKFS